jgi:hypothetical protein
MNATHEANGLCQSSWPPKIGHGFSRAKSSNLHVFPLPSTHLLEGPLRGGCVTDGEEDREIDH